MRVLNSNLGPEILRDLRAKFPGIPNHGVLAGGAVADWFLGLEPNDIDIFVNAKGSLKRFRDVRTASFGMPEVDLTEYGWTQSIAWKQHYEVISSLRQGMLNLIQCRGRRITAARVISGFDLNATRVGIDLDTEQLIWDESFANFLKTKKLQVTALFTPAHTAIRYFNKKARLQCKGDDAVEMAIVSKAWDIGLMTKAANSLPSEFGEVYLAKAQLAMRQGMGEYFDIAPTEKYWTLEPFDLEDLPKQIDPIIFPIHAPQALRSQTIPLSDAYKDRLSMVQQEAKSSFVADQAELFQGAYVRGKVSERMVHTVCLFVTRRPSLKPLLMGLTLERQVQVIRRFARFSRRYGNWIYGLAQAEAMLLDIITDDAFSALVARYEDEYSSPAVIALFDVPRKFLWYSIQQVVTPKALYAATEEMRVTTEDHEKVLWRLSPVFQIKSQFSGKTAMLVHFKPIGDTYLHSARNIVSLRMKTPLVSIIASIWVASHLEQPRTIDRVVAFANRVKVFALNQLSDFLTTKSVLKSRSSTQVSLSR